jgi:hypothetical protein
MSQPIGLLPITRQSSVVVFGAHPDDAVRACGGPGTEEVSAQPRSGLRETLDAER